MAAATGDDERARRTGLRPPRRALGSDDTAEVRAPIDPLVERSASRRDRAAAAPSPVSAPGPARRVRAKAAPAADAPPARGPRAPRPAARPRRAATAAASAPAPAVTPAEAPPAADAAPAADAPPAEVATPQEEARPEAVAPAVAAPTPAPADTAATPAPAPADTPRRGRRARRDRSASPPATPPSWLEPLDQAERLGAPTPSQPADPFAPGAGDDLHAELASLGARTRPEPAPVADPGADTAAHDVIPWFEPPDAAPDDPHPAGARGRANPVEPPPTAAVPLVVAPPAPEPTFAPVPAAAPAPVEQPHLSRRARKRAARPRVRRVVRILRRIDAWSVFKIALIFFLTAYLILVVAGVLLWSLAISTGTIDNAESFIRELFALDSFSFDGGEIFRASVVGGAVLVVAGTGTAVTMAVLFNLISDMVGGIRLTVLEQEPPRRPVPVAVPSATPVAPAPPPVDAPADLGRRRRANRR